MKKGGKGEKRWRVKNQAKEIQYIFLMHQILPVSNISILLRIIASVKQFCLCMCWKKKKKKSITFM